MEEVPAGATEVELDQEDEMEDEQVDYEDAEQEQEEEQEIEIVDTKPSNTIAIHGLDNDTDLEALQFRIKRFGDVTHFARYGKVVVARFKQVKMAYAAKEKLDGKNIEGCKVRCVFGSQDPDHYKRKKRTQNTIEDLDKGQGDIAEGGKIHVETRPPPEENDELVAVTLDASRFPGEWVSQWTPSSSLKEQLDDYDELMKKTGISNRYVVLSNLPSEYKTEATVAQLVEEIIQEQPAAVEMLMFEKRMVAHVTLRSPAIAEALVKSCELGIRNPPQASKVKGRYAPPRKATIRLLFLHVHEQVEPTQFERCLQQYGDIKETRKIPLKKNDPDAGFCFIVTLPDVEASINVRNHCFGYKPGETSQAWSVDFMRGDAAGNNAAVRFLFLCVHHSNCF